MNEVVTVIGDKALEGLRWVLMTKDVLSGSRSKSYDQQLALLKEYAEKSQIAYEMPKTLEAITCIFAEYVQSGDKKTRLFSDKPWTYTRCQEKVQSDDMVVGGFALSGLDVDDNYYDHDDYGVAALRKFF